MSEDLTSATADHTNRDRMTLEDYLYSQTSTAFRAGDLALRGCMNPCDIITFAFQTLGAYDPTLQWDL